MSDQREAPASPTGRYLRALRSGEMDTAPSRPGRRRVLVVVVTLVVGAAVNAWALRIPAGDSMFYPATALLAAVWLGGAFASGPIRVGCEPYRPHRPVLSSVLTAAEDLETGDSERGGPDNAEVLTVFTGTVPNAAIKNVLPCAPGKTFDAKFTINEDGLLRAAEVTGQFFKGGTQEITYTIDVEAYDVEKDIAKP